LLREIKEFAPNNVMFVLVGNKLDKLTEKIVTTKDALTLSQELNCNFYETSTKENTECDNLLLHLVEKLLK
jgi:GTPase SAR1 family protein